MWWKGHVAPTGRNRPYQFVLARSAQPCHRAQTNHSVTTTGHGTMQTEPQVYRLKVDNSGRVVLPADLRQQNHIAEGDTIVVVKDSLGLHIKTLDQVISEVQAEFAKHVPRGVLLSDEINADRRSETERD